MAIIGETSYTGTANPRGNVVGGNNQETGGNKLSDNQKKVLMAASAGVLAVAVAIGGYFAISGNQAAKPGTEAVNPGPNGGGDINGGGMYNVTENEDGTTTVTMPAENPDKNNVGFDSVKDEPGQAELQSYLEQTPYSWKCSGRTISENTPIYETNIDDYSVSVYLKDGLAHISISDAGRLELGTSKGPAKFIDKSITSILDKVKNRSN